MDICIQIIGGFGILASIVSFQCKKHGTILFFRILNEFIFAIQYFLLGAYTGAVVNLIGCVRNYVFIRQISKSKKTTALIVAFSIIFVIFGLASWEGPKSLLIIGAKILSTIAYGNKNTSVVRGIIFTTGTSWLIYNYSVGSIAGVLCEAFTLISLITGIVRLDIIPRLSREKKHMSA